MQKQFVQALNRIDSSWTLFLDRDGVINIRLMDDYVKSVQDFEFIPGSDRAVAMFAKRFQRIFVVTNQQGVGKGLMSVDDLDQIHKKMVSQIQECGGRLDKIYFCPDLKEKNSSCRKPDVGMALQAKKDFPGLSFKKSLMVGDTLNDMLFGKRLGMTTVLIQPDDTLSKSNHHVIDYRFESLIHLAKLMQYV